VALAERGFQVTAVDYSPAMLKRARQHATEVLKNVHFRKVDLNGYLPFGAGSFDGALCVALLQVLDDPTRFLAQVRQSLRPNGYLLVESVRKLGALSRGENLGLRDQAINKLKILVARLAPSVREYSSSDIVSLVQHAGMHAVRTDTYDATFTVLARTTAP
jgi:SAM-dependent methyltransferase